MNKTQAAVEEGVEKILEAIDDLKRNVQQAVHYIYHTEKHMSAQLDTLVAASKATTDKVDQLLALIPGVGVPPPADDTAALQAVSDALKATDAKIDDAIAKLTPAPAASAGAAPPPAAPAAAPSGGPLPPPGS